jgi:uncharacterized protein YecE (DUF72 family)
MSPTSSKRPTFLLGTSGWAHRDWVGTFYPQEMPAGEYLTAYARRFNTVEIEHTFFEIPIRQTVQSWYRRTPDDFLFSPCLPRQITHTQRLRDVQSLLEDFLAVIGDLGSKLGPLLIQMPEDFRSTEYASLESFLQLLPHNQQFAIEFRHGSWLKDTTFRLLEAYQVAWVVVDAPFLPRIPRVTAPFAYVRWHGRPGHQIQRQFAPSTALSVWVPLLRELGRQAQLVYGYVHNRFSGYAPRDCQILQELLGQHE